jgi:hypothetical protein
MTKLTKDTLNGFVPAIVTPFSPAGDIREDAFCDIVASASPATMEKAGAWISPSARA